MESRDHSYLDIKKIKSLKDDMFIYTINGRKVDEREFRKEIRKWTEKQKES